MRGLWTLTSLLLLVAGLSAPQAQGLPAPAFAASGVSVGEDLPALAYAGAGTRHNGLYTSVYDDFGVDFDSHWPMDGVWIGAELPAWRSANAFRTSWKPGITRREVTVHTPIDLRRAYRFQWEVRPGHAAVSVPVGMACSPVQEQLEDHVKRELTPPHQPTAEERSFPDSEASASTPTKSLPAYLGEAAQLVMQQTGTGQQENPPSWEGEVPAGHSRRRRQVSLVGRRGASSSSSASAASASSGPWGASSSAAAASAASGSSRRPGYGYGYRPGGYGYGYRPSVYGQRPGYGRPYPGQYYG